MRTIAHIIALVILNAAVLWVAGFFVKDFVILGGLPSLIILGAVFTALNFAVRPILKLLLGPLILITLGAGILVVNALVLKLLDFLSKDLTILSIRGLLLATLIISLINFVFHFGAKNS